MTTQRRRELLVCAAIFTILIAWLFIWPFTGEDDSVLHYLNAREAALHPAAALGPWARPLYKLMLAWPATYGIALARIFQAIITTILAWQVMRLAEDLGIARPSLAGAMLIWQPLVFALGSDTMTELPFALGATICLRLWNARKVAWCCFIAGLLPMIRPEGFLIACAIAILTLATASRAILPHRIISASLASIGVVLWALACQIIVHNWHYFIDVWSWPAAGYASYGHGSLFHYIIRWPWYCGWILFPLFCLGLCASLRMRVPLSFWAGIIAVHSLLYWRGWFASDGEMRILVTTAPVTALICTQGWNALVNRRLASIALALAAGIWPMVEYARHVKHYECFAVRDVAAFVQANHLLDQTFFTGDKMILAQLGLDNDSTSPAMGRERMLLYLKNLPTGAIGMWDNRNALAWYGISIEDLQAAGFVVLFDSRHTVWDGPEALFSKGWWIEMRYVVMRKAS